MDLAIRSRVFNYFHTSRGVELLTAHFTRGLNQKLNRACAFEQLLIVYLNHSGRKTHCRSTSDNALESDKGKPRTW